MVCTTENRLDPVTCHTHRHYKHCKQTHFDVQVVRYLTSIRNSNGNSRQNKSYDCFQSSTHASYSTIYNFPNLVSIILLFKSKQLNFYEPNRFSLFPQFFVDSTNHLHSLYGLNSNKNCFSSPSINYYAYTWFGFIWFRHAWNVPHGSGSKVYHNKS